MSDSRLVVLALLLLAGCGGPATEGGGPAEGPAPAPGARFARAEFSDLPGWNEDALDDAQGALRRSCAAIGKKPADAVLGGGEAARPVAAWKTLCAAIAAAPDGTALRRTLEAETTPYLVRGPQGKTGLFTGYCEAELRGSFLPVAPYLVPVYGRPVDLAEGMAGGTRSVGRLVRGRPVPYFSRAEIETGAIREAAPVLLWTDDAVDLHIAQIQGSSRVTLSGGERLRIGFAGSNGLPFKGLGRILLDHGLLAPGRATMADIRDWLHAHPDRAPALMRENPRYVFFRLILGEGPIGALGIPLTPGRSLAVDPAFIPLGAPLWLSTRDPDGRPLTRLMVAQDTGAAIKGAVRGDVFWGAGPEAFAVAGRMKSPGSYYLLVPKSPAP